MNGARDLKPTPLWQEGFPGQGHRFTEDILDRAGTERRDAQQDARGASKVKVGAHAVIQAARKLNATMYIDGRRLKTNGGQFSAYNRFGAR